MNNIKLSSRVITITLTILCFITISFGIYFVGFGFDINDEAYQTMNAMDPTINPQAILASYLSHIYGKVFGFSLYSMRVLTFCLNLLSIGAAVYYYYNTKKQLNKALILFVALVWISLCIPVKSRLIGWDCFAIFFTTLSLIMMVKLWKRNELRIAIFLGVLTACATLARIPDIIIVPIATISILYSSKKGERWKYLVCYLASFALSTIFILAIIYQGNIMQWFIDLKSNFVSGHNFSRLVQAYAHTGKFDLINVAIFTAVLIVGRKCINNKKYSTLFYSLLFIVLCILLFNKLDRVHYPINRCLTACIIIFSFTYAIYADKNKKIGFIIRSTIIVGCCLVPMAGSDGGTHKFMNISVIPIILSLFPITQDKKAIATETSYNTMLWVILSACALMMPIFTAKHSVFDGGWYNARSKVHHNLLKNNTTTIERALELNEMLSEGEQILPDNCVIIGHNNRRFFSEYIWGQRNKLWPHEWGDDILDDDNKIELLLEKIYNGEINNIAFVKYGANDKINFEDNKMRSIIQSTELYDCKEYKWFVVFTKKPKL